MMTKGAMKRVTYLKSQGKRKEVGLLPFLGLRLLTFGLKSIYWYFYGFLISSFVIKAFLLCFSLSLVLIYILGFRK